MPIDTDEYTLLCEIAYQSWLDRGKPIGSPETDWTFAKAQLGMHAPLTISQGTASDLEHEQLDVTDDA